MAEEAKPGGGSEVRIPTVQSKYVPLLWRNALARGRQRRRKPSEWTRKAAAATVRFELNGCWVTHLP
jgi:hypothetical protein